jgi:hypothetical protein
VSSGGALGPASMSSRTVTQMSRMLKGKMEFRLGTEQRVCGPGDVIVNPGGSEEHEAWFHKDTEVIDGAIVKRSYLRFEHSSLATAVSSLLTALTGRSALAHGGPVAACSGRRFSKNDPSLATGHSLGRKSLCKSIRGNVMCPNSHTHASGIAFPGDIHRFEARS